MIDANGAAALIVAITGLVAAVGVVIVQLRQVHNLVNSKMADLIEQTRLAALKQGELAGRDYLKAELAAKEAADTPKSL